MSDRNKDVAVKFIEALSAHDPEGAAATLAPDGKVVTKGHSMFAGERPADLVVETIGSFKELFPEGLGLEITSVTGEGDRVVIEAEGLSVTDEGKPYTNQYCFVVTVQDGRIKQINEYLCSAYVEKVLSPMADRLGALKIEVD